MAEMATLESSFQTRRRLARARAEREVARKDVLDALIQGEQRATMLRAWIQAAAPRIEARKDARLLRMLDWARTGLTALDALTDLSVVSEQLRVRDLFPQIDPLHDTLGEPPASHLWRAAG